MPGSPSGGGRKATGSPLDRLRLPRLRRPVVEPRRLQVVLVRRRVLVPVVGDPVRGEILLELGPRRRRGQRASRRRCRAVALSSSSRGARPSTSKRPARSCGTSHVYCHPVPSRNPSGISGGTASPTSRRGCRGRMKRVSSGVEDVPPVAEQIPERLRVRVSPPVGDSASAKSPSACSSVPLAPDRRVGRDEAHCQVVRIAVR